MKLSNINPVNAHRASRAKKADYAGMPLNKQKQELKTARDDAKAERNGIEDQMRDRSLTTPQVTSLATEYGKAEEKYAQAYTTYDAFKKDNKESLKAELKAGPMRDAQASGSMARPESRSSAGDEAPVDRFGMPTHYTTDSGQQIPGYLFPGHATPESGSRELGDELTFERPPVVPMDEHGSLLTYKTKDGVSVPQFLSPRHERAAARPRDPNLQRPVDVPEPGHMPTHFTTESGQQIPAYLFPGFPMPEAGHRDMSDLTFGGPADAAAHGSMEHAPESPRAESPAQARLQQAREDLRNGVRRDPRDLEGDTGI